jgi:hypothetical protein
VLLDLQEPRAHTLLLPFRSAAAQDDYTRDFLRALLQSIKDKEYRIIVVRRCASLLPCVLSCAPKLAPVSSTRLPSLITRDANLDCSCRLQVTPLYADIEMRVLMSIAEVSPIVL